MLAWALVCHCVISSSQDAPAEEKPEDAVRLEEEVTVTAGRTERRIQDVPLRIEVVDRDDIEEKALMTPGSVAMLLGETTGLRVQTTAPTTAAANVRIQGLRGRYSLLLSDGLPLYGMESGSLNLLQVPPLDLGQVEIVKGAASALYGPTALGGVINLVSRAATEAERLALFNLSTQSAADASLWMSSPARGQWSGSLLASSHGQRRQDLDQDGWSDLPSFARGVLRPRASWNGSQGRSLFLTAGAMFENRNGGTEEGRTAPDGRPFAQGLDSRRVDAGLVGRFPFASRLLLSTRGSLSFRRENRTFGDTLERGERTAGFVEAVLSGTAGRHTWLVGAASLWDSYDALDLPALDYTFTTPGLFAQDEVKLGSRGALGLSARLDHHSAYGTLASPRLSLLSRFAAGWTARVSAGTGFFAPTPFLEETEETGLSRLLPLSGVMAEKAKSASVDLGFKRGRFELNGAVFGSRVDRAAQRRLAGEETYAVVNAELPIDTWGLEFLGRYKVEAFTLLLTHSYTDSSEEDPDAPGASREVPLTPGHALSLNVIWEAESWSVGLEVYYSGRQPLDANPYREEGRAYGLFGVLAQKQLGRWRVFVNLENIGNVRQTRFDPLLLPARAEDGRWTVDAWAPLDGFVANGGVRVRF